MELRAGTPLALPVGGPALGAMRSARWPRCSLPARAGMAGRRGRFPLTPAAAVTTMWCLRMRRSRGGLSGGRGVLCCARVAGLQLPSGAKRRLGSPAQQRLREVPANRPLSVRSLYTRGSNSGWVSPSTGSASPAGASGARTRHARCPTLPGSRRFVLPGAGLSGFSAATATSRSRLTRFARTAVTTGAVP